MGNMVIATTSLDTRSPFKEAIKNAKSSGKQSTKQATKKSMRKSANMSRYQSKIPKLNVMLDTKRNAKTNGSALIIPNKKILITVKTRNGNQQRLQEHSCRPMPRCSLHQIRGSKEM